VYTSRLITDWENQKEISQKVKKLQIEDLLERKPICFRLNPSLNN
jgi:hypothetical protein